MVVFSGYVGHYVATTLIGQSNSKNVPQVYSLHDGVTKKKGRLVGIRQSHQHNCKRNIKAIETTYPKTG